MGLMTHALAHTLEFSFVEVVLQDGLVVWMCAVLNYFVRTLTWTHPADIGETLIKWYCDQQEAKVRLTKTDEPTYLFGDNDIEVMLRLIHMCTHGHDTGDTRWVRLARARTRRVHDAVLGTAEEIRATAQAVKHAATVYASAVCVCVDVDFDGRVHSDDSQPANDLR